MLKQVYRVLILIGVFIASLYYFSKDIKEVVFDIDNTTVMGETTFPLVSIRAGDEVINRIHGYSSNLAANKIREGVVPLGADQTFEVIINQETYDIKKLGYELREFDGNELIEADSVSVFTEEGVTKTAKIKIKSELIKKKDYAVKITLITSESKKIYFYQRVMLEDEVHLSEKLDFVKSFHNAIKDKSSADWITDRLEPDKKKENNTLAKVDIHSSYDLITWGNLRPEFLTEVIPTVIEISPGLATVELEYFIRAEIAGMPELFEVKEYYRVQYTTNQIYLLNYERSMEAVFDSSLASISKSQLKLGITSDTEIPFLASPDQKKLAFIRNRDLWFYNLEGNELIRVFSFRQENTDYIRDLYNQHDIRILSMDPEGNMDFLVYGYMNRGQYEGRVGIILYRYIRAENRIEERVYIPVEEPYQLLKENLGSLAYVNALEVFYLQLYNNIYSYNLITGQLEILAEGISDQIVCIPEKAYAAWQGNPDPRQSRDIKIMQLETGKIQTIDTRAGYNILLLDMIDFNLIYGFAAEGDITTLPDGRTIIPLNVLEIATIDRKVLKNYSKIGYFITDVAVKGNIVELSRVMRINKDGKQVFVPAPQDYIMNQVKNEKSVVEVTSRVTDEALTERYLTMPSGFTMAELPKQAATVNTVISQDPTLRLQKLTVEEMRYYTYVAGEIAGEFKEASKAIALANEKAGVVQNNRNQLVWERIARPAKTIISGYDGSTIAQTEETLESCVRLLLKHLGKGSGIQSSLSDSTVYDIIAENTENTPVTLAGVTLEEALYYIAKGRPVIAMTDHKNAVLIFGYDGFNINVADPAQGKIRKIGLQDSKEMFEGAGNVYISYLE